MTRDDIIRMAREAGIEHHENVDEMRSPFCDGVWFEDFEHFASLIAAAEREECAILCDAISSAAEMNGNMPRMATANDCADAIRARGQ
jgi:hypothetical protein